MSIGYTFCEEEHIQVIGIIGHSAHIFKNHAKGGSRQGQLEPNQVLANVWVSTATFASKSGRESDMNLKLKELKFEVSKASEKACKNYNSSIHL